MSVQLPHVPGPLSAPAEDAGTSPLDVLEWVTRRFAGWKTVATTGFGMEGCVLVDLLARCGEPCRVFYLDTDFLFPETYALRDRLIRRYPRLTFVRVAPDLSPEAQAQLHGPELWTRDADLCCKLRKVEPMRVALEGYDVWLTGIRREQSSSRAACRLVEWDWQYELIKVNPLAYWTRAQVWEYVQEHALPYNPLHEKGYPSLGCTYCTRAVPGTGPGEYSRAGRWPGTGKSECGLHIEGVAAGTPRARTARPQHEADPVPNGDPVRHGDPAPAEEAPAPARHAEPAVAEIAPAEIPLRHGERNGDSEHNGHGLDERRRARPVEEPVARAPGEPESTVEAQKRASCFLRGTISSVLADEAQTHFEAADITTLKFHGIYQQDDRDERVARRRAGLDKAWQFMARVAVPGGRCSAAQYLALDDIAGRFGNGTVRITARQSIQLHGVLKGDLHGAIADVNKALLSTLAACGDVPRNVMASPAPFADEAHCAVRELAIELARALRPATGAYHEIWIDGEKVETDGPPRADEEPFFGATYLPRKFKLGVALDGDNSIDLYAYDAGLVGITENGRVIGYNLLAGGGLGMTHDKPDTIARLASPIGFVEPADAIEAIRTVIAIFRDHGNREDRRHARLKYVIEAWGVETFRERFRERFTGTLRPIAPVPPPRQRDWLGRFAQGDGRDFIGVFVPNGRVTDDADGRRRSAFREICTLHAPTIVFTPMQSILFADLEPAVADLVEAILERHGVARAETLSNVRRYSMACPALPTCGLALADAERIQPQLVGALEEALDDLGVADAEITFRITGCPNGCARPYNADIGLVGRKPGVYHVYVGGGLGGDRMADLFAPDTKAEDLIETLRPLLVRFRGERTQGEALGDWYRRAIAPSATRHLLTGQETPTSSLVTLEVRR